MMAKIKESSIHKSWPRLIKYCVQEHEGVKYQIRLMVERHFRSINEKISLFIEDPKYHPATSLFDFFYYQDHTIKDYKTPNHLAKSIAAEIKESLKRGRESYEKEKRKTAKTKK